MTIFTLPGIALTRLLDYPLARCPEKIAYIDDRGSITFGALETQAARLSRAFADAGAKPGDRIALILPNCIEFMVVETAILRSAMVKVPLNIRFHSKEVLYSLGDCEPTVLVCDMSMADAVAKARADLPSLKAIFVVGGERADCISYVDALAAGDGPARSLSYGPTIPYLYAIPAEPPDGRKASSIPRAACLPSISM